jgi:hypothetical protein
MLGLVIATPFEVTISEEIMILGILMEIGEPNGEGCDRLIMSSDTVHQRVLQ